MTRGMAIAVGLAIASGAACGGGDSDHGSVQQADVDQLTGSIANALAAANDAQSSGSTVVGTSPSHALARDARSTSLSSGAAVNSVVACPVDGHVTTTGNVYASCPTPPATGACTMSGAITIDYGDRTNNLDDCTFAHGLVVDGSLFVTLSGTASGTAITLSESLTGSLSLNRKGPTGGLVPLETGGMSSCFVFLTAKIPQRTITGDVCGIAVNRTF